LAGAILCAGGLNSNHGLRFGHLAVYGRVVAGTHAHQIRRVVPCASFFDRPAMVDVFGDRVATLAVVDVFA